MAAWARYRVVPLDDTIEIRRGDTFTLNVTGLGNISARTNVWFTIKDDKDDADVTAVVQIDEGTGLLYIAGTAATVAANGSVVVTDLAAGDLTVTLEAIESAKLADSGKFYYDIQVLYASGVVETLTRGRVVIIGDVTRVTS